MRDLEALRTLERLPLDELIEGQRKPGRAEMDPAFVAHWTEQHHRAVELAVDPRSSRATKSLAQLLKDLTFPLIAQQEDPIPEYYPYTGVHHLEWYLENRHQSWDRLKTRAAEGVFHTLVDFIRFESQSLAGLEPWHRESFHREDVTQRIHVLERAVEKCHELGRLIPEAEMDRNRTARRYDALGEYAEEPSRVSAMVEFSMMPQTRFHDEVLFLRIIHISELCFFGIRVAVREARELLCNGLVHAAVIPLRQALAFGAMLYESFKVMRTMTPARFLDFRAATGKASAIKSLNYQLLEIHLRGVNADKLEVIRRIPHLRPLSKFAHTGFRPLRKVLREADPAAQGWDDVLEAARALDQKWLTWRGLHLSFAILYLPPEGPGTGDTAGAPYLRKFLKSGLFDDTEVDMELVKELFGDHPEIPNLFRARPNEAFAPVEELRAYRES